MVVDCLVLFTGCRFLFQFVVEVLRVTFDGTDSVYLVVGENADTRWASTLYGGSHGREASCPRNH